MLVSQDEPLVERFTRQGDGAWVLRVHRAGERVELPSVECVLPVDEIHRRVFDAAAS